jgi:hypothetical protein
MRFAADLGVEITPTPVSAFLGTDVASTLGLSYMCPDLVLQHC